MSDEEHSGDHLENCRDAGRKAQEFVNLLNLFIFTDKLYHLEDSENPDDAIKSRQSSEPEQLDIPLILDVFRRAVLIFYVFLEEIQLKNPHWECREYVNPEPKLEVLHSDNSFVGLYRLVLLLIARKKDQCNVHKKTDIHYEIPRDHSRRGLVLKTYLDRDEEN